MSKTILRKIKGQWKRGAPTISIDAYLEKFDNSDWVINAARDHLTIWVSDGNDMSELTITPADVIHYYCTEAGSRNSLRSLAGYPGDWRYMNELANTALQFFANVDGDTFRQQCRANGLTPKF